MLADWNFHIEISSKCTLKCPRCPRLEVSEGLINTELPLSFFHKNFTPEFIKEKVEKIIFCGDDGDPIYAHDLIDVIKYFKSHKKISVVLITNGSYKKKDWWVELANTLDDHDQIHFSIDGYDSQSNSIYRVNSDWDSIIEGIKTVREHSNVFMYWAAIYFKFNQKHIDSMISQAKELKMDRFQLTRSTKFGSYNPSMYGENDELEPDTEFVSSEHRYQREYFELTNRIQKKPWIVKNLKFFKNTKTIDNIKPLCHIGTKGIFITSQGDFYPCCWTANRYTHNTRWQDISKTFNLYNNNLEDVLKNKIWEKDFLQDQHECRIKCSDNQVTEKYAVHRV